MILFTVKRSAALGTLAKYIPDPQGRVASSTNDFGARIFSALAHARQVNKQNVCFSLI